MLKYLQEETENTPPKNDEFEITPEMVIWKAMYLPDPLVRAVWELGFTNPTAIQVLVLYTSTLYQD